MRVMSVMPTIVINHTNVCPYDERRHRTINPLSWLDRNDTVSVINNSVTYDVLTESLVVLQ